MSDTVAVRSLNFTELGKWASDVDGLENRIEELQIREDNARESRKELDIERQRSCSIQARFTLPSGVGVTVYVKRHRKSFSFFHDENETMEAIAKGKSPGKDFETLLEMKRNMLSWAYGISPTLEDSREATWSFAIRERE